MVSVQGIIFKCGDTEVYVPLDKMTFFVDYRECDLCDEHVDIFVEFLCANCGKRHNVRISAW